MHASQDGGDSTSITSAIENEIKKPIALLKCKRSSIKRKVQSLSHESDDTVTEPLLQKDKEKAGVSTQIAKHNLLSKPKTDVTSERAIDKDKLLADDKLPKSMVSNISDVTDTILSNSITNEKALSKFTNATTASHNLMNTNVFSCHDPLKETVAPKSQILVKIDGNKQVGYNPSPLIFTTAKIHIDGTTKNMEPVHVTPVPILSTIEVSVLNDKGETSRLVNSNISAIYSQTPKNNMNNIDHDQKQLTKTNHNTSVPPDTNIDANILISTNKMTVTSKETKIAETTHNNLIANSKICSADFSISAMPEISKSTIQTVSNDTKVSLINNSIKDNGTINEIYETASARIKIESSKYSEKKSDLNISVTSDSLDPLRSKVSENLKLQKNTCDMTSKNQSDTNTKVSFGIRQLQRQNIVTEESMSKLTSDNGLKSSHTLADCLTTKFETTTQLKSPTNKMSTIHDKTHMPKNCAKSATVTGATTLPMTTSSAVNKISVPITTAAGIAALTTADIDKIKTPIASAVFDKTSTFVTTITDINNTATPMTTTFVINKTSAPTNISSISKKPDTPLTSLANVAKTCALVTTVADINKTFNTKTIDAFESKVSVPTTIHSTVKTSPTPLNTTGTDSKTSTSIITTSTYNANTTTIADLPGKKMSTSLSTSVSKTLDSSTRTSVSKPSISVNTSANKVSSPKNTAAALNSNTSILSDKTTTSSNIKLKSLNTSSPKPVVAKTSSRSIDRISISESPVKSDTRNASSNTKSQVSNAIKSKPSSTIATKTTKDSIDVTPKDASLPIRSPVSKTISQESIGNMVQNTKKTLTSNVKPLTAKSTTPVCCATPVATAAEPGISNVISTTKVSTTKVSTDISSKPTVSNTQSEIKSKEHSNGSKSLKKP